MNRVAVLSIIIENVDAINDVNRILNANRDYIIGRMGLPYKNKNINIISIVLDAPEDITNLVSGKIGRLNGVSAKTNYARV